MPQGILGSYSYRMPTPDQSLTVPRDPLEGESLLRFRQLGCSDSVYKHPALRLVGEVLLATNAATAYGGE